MENLPITLNVDLAKSQVIIAGLAELKLGSAIETFVDVRGQVQRQLEEAQKPKEPEAPPVDPEGASA